jgi:hypothetical protein
MTAPCIHELDPAQCAQCSPRPAALVLCTDPNTGETCLHRASCYSAQDPADGRTPWPRRPVTKAEADANRYPRCKSCTP